MVDYRTYLRFHPSGPVPFGRNPATSAHDYGGPVPPGRNPATSAHDHGRQTLQQDSVPTEKDLYTMPPNVHGFVIQDKKWGELTQPYLVT
jgi:hypothetical protein